MKRRQRGGYLVLGVLVAHLLLISAQVESTPGTSVLHAATFGLLAEAQRLTSSTFSAVRELLDGYIFLRRAYEEKLEHEETIARLRMRIEAQNALIQQIHSLEEMLEFEQTADLMTLKARVIGVDATPWFRTITIDRGLRDGVRSELAVIDPGGVVGRVVGAPAMRAAKVQLLIDRNAAAGAIIERTRAPGVVVGAGDGEALRMEYVAKREDVRVGDKVVTSGDDGIYPRGLALGTVAAVRPGQDLHAIDIEPAIAFDRLEHVMVVTHDERIAAVSGSP